MTKPAARRTAAAALMLAPALAPACAAAQPAHDRAARASWSAPAARPGHGAFRPGASGLGDPYYPSAGNGGYDVSHYDIALTYRPRDHGLAATTRITATATQDLSAFDLDFAGNRIGSVTVDGASAAYRRSGQELVVTPKKGLPKGAAFTVAVTYAGRPQTSKDPDLGRTGWIPTRDGVATLSQPFGSATWFPLNDHPADKATFAYRITVPKGLAVVANGEPGGTERHGSATTFRWSSDRPMAGYLAMIAIGRFAVLDGHTPGGVRSVSAYDPAVPGDVKGLQRITGEVTDWARGLFGPYPFASTGGVVDDESVGYALETQNRPTYPGGVTRVLAVHELAHQWFGDSVSIRQWKDIWLNEGFATYAEWLWHERHGGASAAYTFRQAYERVPGDPVWKIRPADPGRAHLFDYFPVYLRGAMTLHALRTAVGDRAFFAILRGWAGQHAYGNAGTADFVRYAEQVSGKRLGGLFQAWLSTPAKPPMPARLG
ncbi:M1 family metallopeptidase [Actinomadura macrotermitis]|uniref:Aminopeptidase N n=1 Tax=Actinomadura macrotermitis TaxID=2585200 RepID=A0A7K0BST1_9ACTN|nr:hypothetical protein [Actinomadura macrotermitis]